MSNELMPNFLKKRAFLTPSRTALVFGSEQYTFQQLYEKCVEAAGRMYGYGLREGQYVSLLLTNHSDSVVLLFSLQLLGVKAVLLNTRLAPEELNYQLKDSNTAYLLTESMFLEKVEKLDAHVIVKEDLFAHPFVEPPIVNEISLEDVCSIMYTSGTTGSPKGVMQTYGNHWWSAVGSALNLGLHEGDGWLCAVPIFHISGYSILMRSVIYGMKIVLHESFDVQKTLVDIENEKVTTMSVVSTMLSRLLEQIEGPMPNHFRCMLLGGGPAPLSMLEKCVELQIPVYQTYGMTETASQFVTLSPEYSLSKLGSAGKPLFPAQMKIVDSDDFDQQPFLSGEIYVKGPNVTIGYLNREEKSHLKDGWFPTGDVGYVDEEGFLYVQDRRSDLIISGGENIYPAEIEDVLQGHHAIREAGVIGMDHPEWGQVPVAFVVSSKVANEDEIIDFCATRLAKYKVPKKIMFVEELPRNASNKLLRRRLKEWVKGGFRNED